MSGQIKQGKKSSVPSHPCLFEQELQAIIFTRRMEDLFQIQNSRFLEF